MMNFAREYYPYPLGVRYVEEKGEKGLFTSFVSESEECGIVLFDRRSGVELSRYPFSKERRVGKVYYQMLSDIEPKNISYLFYEGNKLVADKRAKGFAGADCFGEAKGDADYKAVVEEKTYDWGTDSLPKLPYEECIVYCLHVRGFTKHNSSGVKAKGTFAGIIEKIPYLKELGITTLELQPAYEFNELPLAKKDNLKNTSIIEKEEIQRINYWGYKEGFYYAPKRSYSKGNDAAKEFKDMVKALHENRMEVVMQFYFPNGMTQVEILEILRFWRVVYHVDGFHLMGNGLPIKDAASDVFLQDCKLWYYDFPVKELYSDSQKPAYRNLGFYNDGFLYDVRRLLKGDEGMIYDVMQRLRANPSTNGVINYVSNYYGFTMMDMVSYERKYNEDNGENNRDGSDYNCSWNCGAEGPSRKKQVLALREKQLKNAFTFLLLAHGTPLFFMGDEFGNSQKGNNNPYCQDNEISWLNWRDLNKNKALYAYVKELIAFRKAHDVFSLPKECMLMDYKSCGYPDLSYHGSEAWKPSWEPYSRHIGFMLCGEYAQNDRGNYYYVAINMYWEAKEFALPKLPKGKKWKCSLATTKEYPERKINSEKVSTELISKELKKDDTYIVASRSIAVFVGSK